MPFLQVLYFLTLLFQPVLFGYFACPFHLSFNLIVIVCVLRSNTHNPRLFVLPPNMWQYTVCCLFYTFISYPLNLFHILVRSPHVQDNQIYCLLQLPIADSPVHLWACPDWSMVSFFSLLFRLTLTVATTGLWSEPMFAPGYVFVCLSLFLNRVFIIM